MNSIFQEGLAGMNEELDEWDVAVLEEAWEYLQKDNIDFATKLERAVKVGKSPDELVRRFLKLAGEHRGPKARRIENAARYLQTQKLKA